MAINKKANSKSKAKTTKADTKADPLVKMISDAYGQGSIMLGTGSALNVPRIPTGVLGLDNMLGGGVPLGRIIEIYGPESSGKTTLTLTIAKEFQKANKSVAFIDAEHALDTEYAAKLGVDIPNTYITQPDNGEQALNIAQMLVESGKIGLIIIDSVAALTPKSEIEGEVGDSHMGLQARMMGQALRKLTGEAKKNNVTIIFINQLRMKIGVMFGNPETTSGGNALKFYATIRLDIRRIGSMKDGDEVIGNQVRIKAVKNKVAPPFRQVELDIKFGSGYDVYGDIAKLGTNFGVVQKAGAWISYKDLKEQGVVKFGKALAEREDYIKEIREQVLELGKLSKEERDELKKAAKTDNKEEEKTEEPVEA